MQDQFNLGENNGFEHASIAMEVGTNIGGVRNSTQSLVSSTPISNNQGASDHEFRNSFSGYSFQITFHIMFIELLLCQIKIKQNLLAVLELHKVLSSYLHLDMQLNTFKVRQEIRHPTKTRTFTGKTLVSLVSVIHIWMQPRQCIIR